MALDNFKEIDQFKLLHSWLKEQPEREVFFYDYGKRISYLQEAQAQDSQKPNKQLFCALTNYNILSIKSLIRLLLELGQ